MTDVRFAAYEQVGTLTADPPALVLMLYDGAVRFLRRAERALAQGDTVAFAQAQNRAHAIVAELRGALDPRVGAEVGTNLARLYDFMLVHLSEGLVAKSPAHVQHVLGLLETLRDAFRDAVEQTRRGPA